MRGVGIMFAVAVIIAPNFSAWSASRFTDCNASETGNKQNTKSSKGDKDADKDTKDTKDRLDVTAGSKYSVALVDGTLSTIVITDGKGRSSTMDFAKYKGKSSVHYTLTAGSGLENGSAEFILATVDNQNIALESWKWGKGEPSFRQIRLQCPDLGENTNTNTTSK